MTACFVPEPESNHDTAQTAMQTAAGGQADARLKSSDQQASAALPRRDTVGSLKGITSSSRDLSHEAATHIPKTITTGNPDASAAACGHADQEPAAQSTRPASGFTTGTGRPDELTAQAQAPAHALMLSSKQQAGTKAPAAVPHKQSITHQVCSSGATTGTGENGNQTTLRAHTVLDDQATDRQTELKKIAVAAAQPPDTGNSPGHDAPAVAPVASGFITGLGTAAKVSADHKTSRSLQQHQAAGQQATEPSHSAHPAASSGKVSQSTSEKGKAPQLKDTAQPQAQQLDQDDRSGSQTVAGAEPASMSTAASLPSGFASGFTSGTGKAVQLSAAAQARAKQMLKNDNIHAQPTAGAGSNADTAEPSHAASGFTSGFTSGTGKAVKLSAAAQARAKQMLEDDGSDAQPTAGAGSIANTAGPSHAASGLASGFTSGTGKAVQLSAAAQARAKQLLEDDNSHAQPSAGAESHVVSAASGFSSGFTSGTGKTVTLSAAAQEQARKPFQDHNAAPLSASAGSDTPGPSTAAAENKAGRKAAGARPALGTPRTGPRGFKPVLKRVHELSKSTGGKLFKKPRMSKGASPFCQVTLAAVHHSQL